MYRKEITSDFPDQQTGKCRIFSSRSDAKALSAASCGRPLFSSVRWQYPANNSRNSRACCSDKSTLDASVAEDKLGAGAVNSLVSNSETGTTRAIETLTCRSTNHEQETMEFYGQL